LALRPERVAISTQPIAGVDNCLPGAVEFVSYLGSSIDIHIRLSPAERVIAQLPNRAGGLLPGIGDRVHAGWAADAATVFAGSATTSP
jgi:putative spermidine/putrescine transport system ATP-binding protein